MAIVLSSEIEQCSHPVSRKNPRDTAGQLNRDHKYLNKLSHFPVPARINEFRNSIKPRAESSASQYCSPHYSYHVTVHVFGSRAIPGKKQASVPDAIRMSKQTEFRGSRGRPCDSDIHRMSDPPFIYSRARAPRHLIPLRTRNQHARGKKIHTGASFRG